MSLTYFSLQVLLAFLLSFDFCHVTFAQSPTTETFKLSSERVTYPGPVRGLDGAIYDGSYYCSHPAPGTGERFASLLLSCKYTDGNVRYQIRQHRVQKGTLIPFFGTLCEVGVVPPNSLVGDGGVEEFGHNPGRLELRKVIREERIQYGPLTGFVAIPLKAKLIRYGRVGEAHEPFQDIYGVDVDEISSGQFGSTCNVLVSFVGLSGNRPSLPNIKRVVKVLDEITVPLSKGYPGLEDDTFRIKRIVPPDSKTQAIGWVVLDPLSASWK